MGEEPVVLRDTTFEGPAAIHTGSGPQINHFANTSPRWQAQVSAALPARPSGFVGRGDDLRALLHVLSPQVPGTDSVAVCAVDGLAGVGKSGFALHAAHAAIDRGWFQGAAFCNLRGYDPQLPPLGTGDAVAELLRALGVAEDLPVATAERLAIYRSVLARIAAAGARVLLVFDNVAQVEQIEDLLPGQTNHRTLITSRHRLGALDARRFSLDELDDPEAVELLATMLRTAVPGDPRASEHAELTELAHLCGGLPLALKIVGAQLRNSPRLPVAKLAEQLAEKVRLDRLEYGVGTRQSGVRAAFLLSYNGLPEAQACMLRLLAADPGLDVAAQTAAVLADLPQQETDRLLQELDGANLATRGVKDRWGMHDLMRLFAREQLNADPVLQDQARGRLQDYYLATAHAAADHLQAPHEQPIDGRFAGLREALAWLDDNRGNLVATVRMAAESTHPDVAVHLPLALAQYFAWRRHVTDSIETHTIAISVASALKDWKSEGMAQNGLGLALQLAQRFEDAIDHFRRAATLFREVGDKSLEGLALENLGLSYGATGQGTKAIEAYTQALAGCRETGDRQGEGIMLAGLAIILGRAQRHNEAIYALERAIVIFQQTKDLSAEAATLNNLGLALRDVCRLDEAIAVLQRAVALHRRVGDQHSEIDALTNLGNAQLKGGQLDACKDSWRKALELVAALGDGDRAARIQKRLESLATDETPARTRP